LKGDGDQAGKDGGPYQNGKCQFIKEGKRNFPTSRTKKIGHPGTEKSKSG